MTTGVAEHGLASAIPVLAALGDRTRVDIVLGLGSSGPSTAAKLSAGMTISQQAVGKQLAILAHAGIVSGQRSGREHIWTLNPRALATTGRVLADASAQWDAALDRLRSLVEEP